MQPLTAKSVESFDTVSHAMLNNFRAQPWAKDATTWIDEGKLTISVDAAHEDVGELNIYAEPIEVLVCIGRELELHFPTYVHETGDDDGFDDGFDSDDGELYAVMTAGDDADGGGGGGAAAADDEEFDGFPDDSESPPPRPAAHKPAPAPAPAPAPETAESDDDDEMYEDSDPVPVEDNNEDGDDDEDEEGDGAETENPYGGFDGGDDEEEEA